MSYRQNRNSDEDEVDPRSERRDAWKKHKGEKKDKSFSRKYGDSEDDNWN